MTLEVEQPTRSSNTRALASRRLGVLDLVFFVVSAAAPLTVVAGAAPTAFKLGGIGAPGAMLTAGIVLIFFAIGFTAMARYVRNTGAFYVFGARGLGKPAGVGVALVTTFAYGALCICLYGYVGFFSESTVAELFGLHLPWWVYSLLTVALTAFLGYRRIDIGAKVLGVLLAAEVLILLVIAFAELAKGGPEPMSFESFAPSNIFAPGGVGALFVFGFGAYIGFEGTAIYTEEAKNPKRTVPIATYAAIAFLGIFYAFTFWILTVAFGADRLMAFAASDKFEDMIFDVSTEYLGHWAFVVTRILIVTSFIAGVLAFHNACSRYLFSMGREGLLPRSLGRTHPVTQVPHRANARIK